MRRYGRAAAVVRRCGGAAVRWCGPGVVRQLLCTRRGAAVVVGAAAEPIYWQRRGLSRDGEKKNDKT